VKVEAKSSTDAMLRRSPGPAALFSFWDGVRRFMGVERDGVVAESIVSTLADANCVSRIAY
jgi:hypothetical protein